MKHLSTEPNSARREEPKTGLPLEIGDKEGIPLDQSPKSPYVYLQYTTQSVCPHIPPVYGVVVLPAYGNKAPPSGGSRRRPRPRLLLGRASTRIASSDTCTASVRR